jgi:MFS family permease
MWQAVVSKDAGNSLVAARVLVGFAAAAGEALGVAICADLFFLHERGWWIGLYMAISGTSGTFGGLITSFAPVGDGIFGLPSHLIKLKVGRYDYFQCNFFLLPGDLLLSPAMISIFTGAFCGPHHLLPLNSSYRRVYHSSAAQFADIRAKFPHSCISFW